VCDWITEETREELVSGLGPCPRCGETDRGFSVDESGGARGFNKIVDLRLTGSRRPSLEVVSGDERHNDTKTWKKLTRVIDRRNDLYHEVIRDPATGQVLETREPLSEHFRHRSTGE
jgi:hypothetical protein